MKEKIIIKKGHSDDCSLKNDRSYFPDFKRGEPFFFGNYRGNERVNLGRNNYWLKVTCNDPGCFFRAVVNWEVINDLLIKKTL